MDILNWIHLIKNRLVKTTVQNPEKDLVILGGNVSYAKRGDKYQSYGITVQDFADSLGASGVSEIIAGTNISIDPEDGRGSVTINATGGLPEWIYIDDASKSITNFSNYTTGGYAGASTAFGLNALYSNTVGSFNTAFGKDSLYNNTTGAENLAIGPSALYDNTTGGANVAIGSGTLSHNTTGQLNVTVGPASSGGNTTGMWNVAIGAISSVANTTGNNNTAVGGYTLYSNLGSNATAIGYEALYNSTVGNSNVAIGHVASYSNTTGYDNVAIGSIALYQNTTGYTNTAVGYNAGFGNTTGRENTVIGSNTGTGNFNRSVILGYQAAATASNQFVVGSAIANAGAVTTETLATTKTWSVRINGVNQKILLA